MSSIYNPATDPRFAQNLNSAMVNLLDTHGFPIIPLQPKNVHLIAEAYGNELNYYIGSSLQLYQQGHISLASGIDLNNIGNQFNLPRLLNETDQVYRIRLLSNFSPKKVTQPYIQAALNVLVQTTPPVTLFTPWMHVFTFDNNDPIPQDCYDIGDSRMWSPDEWRSGVLVVESGWTSALYGVVEELVAMGVLVIYKQYQYTEAPITLKNLNYNVITMNGQTPINAAFWYDLSIPSNYDYPQYQYDTSTFFEGLSEQFINWYSSSPMEFGSLVSTEDNTFTIWQTTKMQTIYPLEPGNWIQITIADFLSDVITLSDSISVEFNGEATEGQGDIIVLTDAVGIIYSESHSDSVLLGDQLFASVQMFPGTFTENLPILDSFVEGQQLVELGDGSTLNGTKHLDNLWTTTLNDPYSLTLGKFKLALSPYLLTQLYGNTTLYGNYKLAPSYQELKDEDKLGTWRLGL